MTLVSLFFGAGGGHLVEPSAQSQIQIDTVIEALPTRRDQIAFGLQSQPLRFEDGDVVIETGAIPVVGEGLGRP